MIDVTANGDGLGLRQSALPGVSLKRVVEDVCRAFEEYNRGPQQLELSYFEALLAMKHIAANRIKSF